MKYRVCPGVVIASVCGEHLIVATGEARGKVPYVKSINETGVWFWKQFEKQLSEDEIVSQAVQHYHIRPEEAKSAFDTFFQLLQEEGYLIVTPDDTPSPAVNP